MRPPSNEGDDEPSEDTPGTLPITTTKEEMKAATERFLRVAISKTNDDELLLCIMGEGSLDKFFKKLSEPWGLRSWHNRRLKQVLSLVRADNCNIEKVQALKGELRGLRRRAFAGDFIVSVNDYKFYNGIEVDTPIGNGTVDNDLVSWAESNVAPWEDIMPQRCPVAAMVSDRGKSRVLEVLEAIEGLLHEWRCHIRSMHVKGRKLQKAKNTITYLLSIEKGLKIDDSQDKMLLGASPEEFKTLIDSMQTRIKEVRIELAEFWNVTSGRHERALIVLQDDIRLQLKRPSTQERADDLSSVTMRQQDPTPYERAQALGVRIKDWVDYETEFCKFRKEIKGLVKQRLELSDSPIEIRPREW